MSQSGTESAEVDPSLKSAASAACNSANKMVGFLSDGKLEWTVSNCVSGYVNGDVSDRTINQLNQLSAYMDAARADPQMRSKYPPTADKDTVGRYVGEIEDNFNSEFSKAAAVDDERKAKAVTEANEARASATVWGAFAISMFGSFLFIAFLIVAIRIEKHLGNVVQKMPAPL